MSPEAPEYDSTDYFRSFFQDDPDGGENGVRIVSESEIVHHLGTAPHITLTQDSKKNIAHWLCARYEGYILYNTDGTIHDSARFLIKMYLKQQKYASPGEEYFDHHAPGVKIERKLQAVFLQMADKLGLDVIIPSPYTDMVLKTDLIFETKLPGNEKRKIALQMTTNRFGKDNKFHAIKQAYSPRYAIKIAENYQVDDVSLLFVKDGVTHFPQLCEIFVKTWRKFCDEGEGDLSCDIEAGELKIHSIKKRKSPHVMKNINEIIPAGVSQKDYVQLLGLPFSPDDFATLQLIVADALGNKNGIPGKRGESKVISCFDDETGQSYFPGLVKIAQKWGKKGWTLTKKPEKMQTFHGRMSPDDYRKIRTLLLQNSLELPRKEQKLQEIAEILEHWFPGIYECIDCTLCVCGTADQKRRLLSYRKVQPEEPIVSTPLFPKLREISPEQEARKKEREEKRRAQSQAHNQRVAEEQIMFQRRIKAAMDVESEINKKTAYSKMLKEVAQSLKKMFPPKAKITLKRVEIIETRMAAVIHLYRKCLELEKEEDGQQKILEYLNDFISRFGTGGK